MAYNKEATYFLLVLVQVISSTCAVDNSLKSDSSNSNSNSSIQTDVLRKTITVGDEFPSISVRLFSNRTEYKIQLNTSNHECTGAFICEAFIPLTEMYCQNTSSDSTNPPYLEINGRTRNNESVSVRWCQNYGIFAQDDFLNLKVQEAVITPKGDWSNTNATVVVIATFSKLEAAQKSRQRVLVGNLPIDLKIANTKTEYEFSLDTTNEGCQGNSNSTGYCSIGAHIEINCPGVSKDSAYLQLDLLLKNNESVSKIFCLIRDSNDSGGQTNISAYLANIQTLTLKPMGSWETLGTSAHVQLHTVMSSRVSKCPMDYFDCRTDCEISSRTTTTVTGIKSGKVLGSVITSATTLPVPAGFTTIVDINDSGVGKLSCIPWTWVCGNEEENENCPESCTASQKFCSASRSSNGTGSTNSKSESGRSTFGECLFYYGFFLIPFGFILIIFSGTIFFIKLRTFKQNRNLAHGGTNERRQRDSSSNSSSMYPIQLFGRLKRNIPYQVVENDTA